MYRIYICLVVLKFGQISKQMAPNPIWKLDFIIPNLSYVIKRMFRMYTFRKNLSTTSNWGTFTKKYFLIGNMSKVLISPSQGDSYKNPSENSSVFSKWWKFIMIWKWRVLSYDQSDICFEVVYQCILGNFLSKTSKINL